MIAEHMPASLAWRPSAANIATKDLGRGERLLQPTAGLAEDIPKWRVLN